MEVGVKKGEKMQLNECCTAEKDRKTPVVKKKKKRLIHYTCTNTQSVAGCTLSCSIKCGRNVQTSQENLRSHAI